MDAVILFSHGSVLCGSGGALANHADRLRAMGDFKVVEVGYLNYSHPPFLKAVQRCLEQNASRIFVVPYFLVPGKFVTSDLPRAIVEAQRLYSNVKFVVAKAIGYDELLADAILDSAGHAMPEESWRDDLQKAHLHCLNRPECPLYETKDCPHVSVMSGCGPSV